MVMVLAPKKKGVPPAKEKARGQLGQAEADAKVAAKPAGLGRRNK